MLRIRLYEHLRRVRVIDTHEHLWDETHRLAHPGDWASLFEQYSGTALAAAGMTEAESGELYAAGTPHERKWEIFSRYFPPAKNTAYLQAVLLAVRDLYDLSEITSDSMRELTRRIRAAARPGFHRWVLGEKAGIDSCMVNCFDTDDAGNRHPLRSWGDTELLRPDLYVDSFIYPTGFSLMERETDMATDTLAGWEQAIDAYFEKYARQCCSIKVGLAYRGSLDFAAGVPRAEAEAIFVEHRRKPHPYPTVRPLVDHLFHGVLRRAADYGLALKFHTGIYAGVNSIAFAAQAGNVRHLAELAIAHPECRFVAMHIAYPHQNELAMAIKVVRNLYAEMSWAWIVDTEAAACFLKQALTAAPVTKVLGFGGDFALVENSYGHLEVARRGMAAALAEMVESGYFDEVEAREAGEWLLRGSAERLFARE